MVGSRPKNLNTWYSQSEQSSEYVKFCCLTHSLKFNRKLITLFVIPPHEYVKNYSSRQVIHGLTISSEQRKAFGAQYDIVSFPTFCMRRLILLTISTACSPLNAFTDL